jgi:hypothetical protein
MITWWNLASVCSLLFYKNILTFFCWDKYFLVSTDWRGRPLGGNVVFGNHTQERRSSINNWLEWLVPTPQTSKGNLLFWYRRRWCDRIISWLLVWSGNRAMWPISCCYWRCGRGSWWSLHSDDCLDHYSSHHALEDMIQNSSFLLCCCSCWRYVVVVWKIPLWSLPGHIDAGSCIR